MAFRLRCGNRLWIELFIRAFLFSCFVLLELMEPVHREILEEEMPLYSHRPSPNTITGPELVVLCVGTPLVSMVLWAISRKDVNDLVCGLLALTLSLSLNGVVTNVLKIAVGRYVHVLRGLYGFFNVGDATGAAPCYRPRPDFFWRCFPDGRITEDLNCSGSELDIREGRKSFPSGHASWMFTGFMFTSLYFAGKLFVFSSRRGHSVRLLVTLVPLLGATLVGISRIRDKWHHWDDVVVGAMLGSVVAILCYFQFYPSLSDADCDAPLPLHKPAALARRNTLQRRTFSMSTLSENMDGVENFDIPSVKLN